MVHSTRIQYATDVKNMIFKNLRLRFWEKNKYVTTRIQHATDVKNLKIKNLRQIFGKK